MGNNINDTQGFSKNDWFQVSQPSNLITLWQNKNNSNIHIQQHKVYTLDKNQLNIQLDLYYRRKNHSRWVAALYFQQKSSQQFCVSRSIAHIFLQKVPIRISDLKDLPNPDAIHTYDQCLQGFGQLASIFGCFRVHPQYIGINQRGVVKVWAGANWSQLGIIGDKISQQEMVKSIIDIVDQYTCQYQSEFPSIKNYLYRKTDSLSFHTAIRQLRQYSNISNGGIIPPRLQSLYSHKNFQQFMEPLLRSTIHHPSQTMSKRVPHQKQVDIYQDQYTNLKKVDSKEDRIVNESFVVPAGVYRSSQNRSSQDRSSRDRSSSLRKDEKGYGGKQLDASADVGNRNSNQNYTIKVSRVKQNQNRNVAHPQNVILNQRSPIQNNNNPQQKPLLNLQYKPAQQPQQQYTQRVQQYQPPKSLGKEPQRQINRSNSREQPRAPPSIHFQIPQSQHQLTTRIMPSNQQSQSYTNLHPITFNHTTQPPPQHRAPLLNNTSIPPPKQSQPPPAARPIYRPPAEQPTSKKPMPESIIMQLYKSQDRFAGNKYDPPTKQFGKVKRTTSIRQQQPKTLITRQTPSTSVLTYPKTSQNPSQLHSIQQTTRQNKKDHFRSPSNYSSTPGQTINNTPSVYASRNNNYTKIDPNDGKSSEQMLQFLRQVRHGS